ESYKEGVDQGTLVGFNFRTRSEYRLAENFDLYIHAKVQLVTRQIQARFADSRTTGIIPYEVVARYRFLNRAEIKVGAINMDFLNSPLLVSKEKSFPGFVESLNWGDESNYLRIFAAQSIPTTTSFESMRSEKEETPTFFSESVQAQLILGGTYRLNGFLTHFRFDDLPSSLAFESSRMGNSILGEFQANSRFRYPFAGWVNGGEICYCKNSVTKFLVGGYQIENREAPLGLNRGQEFLLRADVGLWGLVFSPYYIQFFNERDTVPAAFNSGSRGHNNRNGRGLGLELLFSSYNFRFVGEYIESDVIRTDPNQKNLNSVMLRLETLNVEF
ncbi:MAG: hypothetical protein KDD35_08575, partial [Bdellovibrionales bacterium]|nr:hypothetical protein [Bdellovibrionales bacterium]